MLFLVKKGQELLFQNTCSECLRSLQNLPDFEAEGFEPLKAAVSLRDAQKNMFSMPTKSRKTEAAEKCSKRIHP